MARRSSLKLMFVGIIITGSLFLAMSVLGVAYIFAADLTTGSAKSGNSDGWQIICSVEKINKDTCILHITVKGKQPNKKEIFSVDLRDSSGNTLESIDNIFGNEWKKCESKDGFQTSTKINSRGKYTLVLQDTVREKIVCEKPVNMK